MNLFPELSLQLEKLQNTLLSWQFVNIQVLFCTILRIISCLDYFSLLTGEKLALTCGSKAEAMCQIPAATRAPSSSLYHCCHERVRCRTQEISDTAVWLQLSQKEPSQTSLLKQTQIFFLPTQNCLSPV